MIVKAGQEDVASVVAQSPRRKRRLSQIRKEEVECVARRQHSMEAGDREDPLLSSNWMRRTGWTKLFPGTNRSILVALSRPPTARADGFDVGSMHGEEIVFSAADERKLATVSVTTDRFLDRCEETLRHTDHSLRCCLRSHYPGRSYKSPFELHGRDSTRARYRSLWKRMVYFCIRIHLLGVGVHKDALHLPFSVDLQLSTEGLWSEFDDTTNTSSDARGDLPSQQSSLSPSTMCPNVRRRKGAPASIPQQLGVNLRSPAASSHGDTIEVIGDSDCVEESDEAEDADEEYIPLATSEDEDEADEDDAITLASVSADEDADQSQSALRAALCEAPGERIADLADQNGVDDRLLDAVARFCVFLCTEPYRDGKSASTVMVYFAGVLGISQDGTTFERPKNYTSKLSALIHVARLCLLEATLPRFSYPRLGWDARPCLGQQDVEDCRTRASRPPQTHCRYKAVDGPSSRYTAQSTLSHPISSQDTLNKVREAFLCQGSAAPVGELLSLRAYGRTVSRTDGPTFRVDWSHDGSSVRWDGNELSMADFRGIGHQAANPVHQSIEGVFGTHPPSLDLSILHDRMPEHKNGYSFVHDNRNGLSHGYLELSERVCADPVHNLMTRNGWNERAVRRFLKKKKSCLSISWS